MKIGARYMAIVLGLIFAQAWLQQLQGGVTQLDIVSIAFYGVWLLIAISSIWFGMFFSSGSKPETYRERLMRTGPTWIGVIGLGVILLFHDGSLDRVLVVFMVIGGIIAMSLLIFVIRRISLHQFNQGKKL